MNCTAVLSLCTLSLPQPSLSPLFLSPSPNLPLSLSSPFGLLALACFSISTLCLLDCPWENRCCLLDCLWDRRLLPSLVSCNTRELPAATCSSGVELQMDLIQLLIKFSGCWNVFVPNVGCDSRYDWHLVLQQTLFKMCLSDQWLLQRCVWCPSASVGAN